jgi:putative transposase
MSYLTDLTPLNCASLGIAPQSYYRWRKEYGGMKIDQAKRLKELEQENIRLKKLVTHRIFSRHKLFKKPI